MSAADIPGAALPVDVVGLAAGRVVSVGAFSVAVPVFVRPVTRLAAEEMIPPP
jgi:hypothetical protein